MNISAYVLKYVYKHEPGFSEFDTAVSRLR
jgi:hypothetical protein